MPKLPIIVADSPVARTPYPHADPNVYAGPYIQGQQAAENIQKHARGWFSESMEVLKEKKSAEDLVDAMRMQTQLLDEIYVEDKRLLENYDYNTHPTTLRDNSIKIMERIAKTARNPNVANKFMVAGTRIIGEKTILARTQANQHLINDADAKNSAYMRSTIQTAGSEMGLVMREWHLKNYEDETNALVNKKYLTAQEADRRIKYARTEVDKAIVLRESEISPIHTLAVADKLEKDKTYAPNIEADNRLLIARHLREKYLGFLKEANRMEKENEEKAAKEHQKNWEDAYSVLLVKAHKKELPIPELDAARDHWKGTMGEKYTTLMNIITAPKKDAPSNPLILRELTSDIYGSYVGRPPTTKISDLQKYLAAEILNVDDFEKLSTRLTSTLSSMEDKQRSKWQYSHGEAMKHAEIVLSTKGIGAQDLDGRVALIKDRYWSEMARRSAAREGREDPDAVHREILPKYRNEVWGATQLHQTSVYSILGIPANATPEQIVQLKEQFLQREPKRGAPGRQKWENDLELWRRVRPLQQRIQELEQENKNTPTAPSKSAPAGEKKSWWSEPGDR